MTESVFLELEFALLVLLSFVAPALVYAYLYRKASIARLTVLLLSLCLIIVAGLDLALVSILRDIAVGSSSTFDDKFFVGELRIALYLLPAVFAGTGINMISHLLIEHLTRAEKRHDRQDRS